MIIVAAICHWQEPEMLKRCKVSLRGVVDVVHVHEEPFRGFPGDWIDARTQIEIRADLMQEASELGSWILVIDADETVQHADLERLRHELANTTADYATVTFTDVGGHPEPLPRLYRSFPDTTVKDRHNGYYGNGAFYHGHDYRALKHYSDCTPWLHIRHNTNLRSRQRTKAAETYRHNRVINHEH